MSSTRLDQSLLSNVFSSNNRTLDANATFVLLSNIVRNAEDSNKSLDDFFLISSGTLVFMMQTGFALLTAGSVRSKNTRNVLLQDVMDACLGLTAYYLFGFAFAFGETSNRFIGYSNFALASSGATLPSLSKFFFQWTFAATTSSIVSGAVAERIHFYAYIAYAFFLVSWVYPVVSHWLSSGNGFATFLLAPDRGALDFAGGIAVHLVGGCASLVGAIIIGPRRGRFGEDGKVNPIPGHSAALVTLGIFMLWFGWHGFNPGSSGGVSGSLAKTASRAFVNTSLAAASSGLMTLAAVKLRDNVFDLNVTVNGVLAGLVSATANCGWVECWSAVVIGMIGSLVYLGISNLILRARIDDPLDAIGIHGGAGAWGGLAVGIFNRQAYMLDAGVHMAHEGLIYGRNNLPFYRRFSLLGCQCVIILIVVSWVCVWMGLLFLGLKGVNLLRVSAEDESVGLDKSFHGEEAYPEDRVDLATSEHGVA